MTPEKVETKEMEKGKGKPKKVKGLLYFNVGHTVNYEHKITMFKAGTGYDPKKLQKGLLEYLKKEHEDRKKFTGNALLDEEMLKHV